MKQRRQRMISRFILLWLLALLCLSVVAAEFSPFRVKQISVEGLQRLSAGTVLNYLPLSEGDELRPEQTSDIIESLYRTGFFDDIRLYREGRTLIVSLRERPSIASIKIDGNKDIQTEQLNKVLADIGLEEGRIFDRSSLEQMVRELEGQYFGQGKYGVQVSNVVKPLSDNRVAIEITIKEGEVAKIRRINIVGNQAFSDEQLLDLFELSPPSFWTILNSNDQYARQKLAADLERLRSFYLDHGYINFNVESTQVSIDSERLSVYVTVNIDEGELFHVSTVTLSGDLVLPEEELRQLVNIEAGDVFSRQALNVSTNALLERLGDEGFAFANVNAVPQLDKDRQQVGLTFVIDPGRRVYVRRINIAGNLKTSDEVIRRELRQFEYSRISTARIKRSRTRLQLLGFFDETNIETPAVPGTDDQVDLNISVSERPSGSLTAGLGYSQNQGLLLNANISQNNVFGSGKRVSMAVNNSSVNTVYNFSLTNPYYTPEGISRSFNLFKRSTDGTRANIGNYGSDVFGGGVGFSMPLTELTKASLGLDYENTELTTTSLAPQRVLDFIASNSNQFDIVKTTVGWSYDGRNRAIFPDRGSVHKLSASVAVPGGELQFYKLRYQGAKYWPILSALTGKVRWDTAYGSAYGGTSELPFFERYFTGGSQSVRGFKSNTLGPLDENGFAEGGSFKLNLNNELVFPMPFSENSKSVRMSLFFDVGNVFDKLGDFSNAGLRASLGVSVVWMTPMAPMTFSYAWPVNSDDGDQLQRFQFTLGVVGL